MRYVWDTAKDALNRKKHGLALCDGVPALEDPQRDEWIDNRFEYEEERIVTLGLANQGVLYVVSTEAGEEITRIISVRRAQPHEVSRYLGRT